MWGNKFILIFVMSFFLNTYFVFAYIDPGTSGMIIGSLWQTILAFFGMIVAFLIINPTKKLINKIRNNGKKK